jgi:hypothetical protein
MGSLFLSFRRNLLRRRFLRNDKVDRIYLILFEPAQKFVVILNNLPQKVI